MNELQVVFKPPRLDVVINPPIIREGGGHEPILIEKNISENGIYPATADGADGYSRVTVAVPQGVIIPEGFALYNGYLLPLVPYADGYNYGWIRRNAQTNSWDLVLGTSPWHSRSNASLDSWALEFATQSIDGSRQYSIPIDGNTTTASDWGNYTISFNYYGTTNNRKVAWADHDIMIGTSNNILYLHGEMIRS